MKFKIPSIPKDNDAKGIVVRVLSFEYYLKSFWLTFKDPYIEVEYQISTRRMRLKQSIYLSLLMIVFGIYIVTFPFTWANFYGDKYTKFIIIQGILIIISSIIELFIVLWTCDVFFNCC